MQFTPNSHPSLNFNPEGAPEENRSKKKQQMLLIMKCNHHSVEKKFLSAMKGTLGIVRRRTTNHKYSLVLPSSATL